MCVVHNYNANPLLADINWTISGVNSIFSGPEEWNWSTFLPEEMDGIRLLATGLLDLKITSSAWKLASWKTSRIELVDQA